MNKEKIQHEVDELVRDHLDRDNVGRFKTEVVSMVNRAVAEEREACANRNGCPTCLSPQPHLHPAVQHEGEVSICKDPFHSQVTPQNPKIEMPIGLIWGKHQRDGGTHTEWYAPCGCAFHPAPFPHVHPCSDGHKRPDLHATEEQAIVIAAREWAKAWGKVWDGDESATTESENEVNDKSKALHDAVLDLERELVLRRRRALMPDYDKKLEDWLS